MIGLVLAEMLLHTLFSVPVDESLLFLLTCTRLKFPGCNCVEKWYFKTVDVSKQTREKGLTFFLPSE